MVAEPHAAQALPAGGIRGLLRGSIDQSTLLAGLFILLPLTWALGIDQFVWYCVPLVWAVTALLRQRVVFNQEAAGIRPLVALLLFAAVVSGLSVVGAPGGRQITYLWGLASYFTAFLVYVTLRGGEDACRTTGRLIKAVVATMAVANLAGLGALALGLVGGFEAPFGRLMPAVVRTSDLGGSMFDNALLRGQPTYLFGIQATRVKSFFIYPNTYSLANDVAIGMGLFLTCEAFRRRSWGRTIAWGAAFLLSLGASFASLSRTGIIVVCVGGLAVAYVHFFQRLPRLLTAIGIAGAGFAIWVVYLYRDTLLSVADVLIYARGSGSAESRFATYTLSIQAVLSRPIGFGTQRDLLDGLPATGLPLGTHSQFIAVLFKYGWVGFVAFLGILWRVHRRFLRGIVSHLSSGSRNGGARVFYTALTWSMVSVLLHLLFIEAALDMTSFMMVVTLWVVVELRAGYYEALPLLPAASSAWPIRRQATGSMLRPSGQRNRSAQ